MTFKYPQKQNNRIEFKDDICTYLHVHIMMQNEIFWNQYHVYWCDVMHISNRQLQTIMWDDKI